MLEARVHEGQIEAAQFLIQDRKEEAILIASRAAFFEKMLIHLEQLTTDDKEQYTTKPVEINNQQTTD